MKQHIAKIAAACFYPSSASNCQIRRRVGQAVTTRLVLAMITSRLDYCKSVLAGLPQHTLEPLHHSAARLILNWSRHDHNLAKSHTTSLATNASSYTVQTLQFNVWRPQ